MADYDDLRKLAEAATPGPWEYDSKLVAVINRDVPPWFILEADFVIEENAAYIAAANPATVLALLDELEQLREALEKSNAALEMAKAFLIAIVGDLDADEGLDE